MDWKSCLSNRIAKPVASDSNMVDGLLAIAEQKKSSSLKLSSDDFYAKFSLLYDVARIRLEVLALRKGFRVYNHECYSAFLAEVMGGSSLASRFDSLRKTRNSINYYGTEVDAKEAEQLCKLIEEFIGELPKYYFY